MPENHYYSKRPESELKIHVVSESLRRHLYIFKTTSGVFSFKKIDLGTKVFIKHMFIPEAPSILLDLGCGYGVIGLVLAYSSPNHTVYLVDINKRAIWSTRENVKLNIHDYKSRVFVFQGKYFEPLKGKDLKFDGIYMNPPLRRGKKEFINVCKEIRMFLNPDGFFQFVIKKKMGAPSVYKELCNLFPNDEIEVVFKRSGYWIFHCRFLKGDLNH